MNCWSAALKVTLKTAHRLSTAVVVLDDSSTRQAREKCRVVVWDLSSQYHRTILYAGFEEKIVYAKRLMDMARVPADSVKFAMFGAGIGGTSVGANRNAMLLHTAGELGVCVDDDILCSCAHFRATAMILFF